MLEIQTADGNLWVSIYRGSTGDSIANMCIMTGLALKTFNRYTLVR